MKIQATLLALLLLMSVPAVDAQTTPFMEDKAGDVSTRVAGNNAGAPSDLADHLDLLSLEVVEVPAGFEMTLRLQSLQTQAQTFLDSSAYRIYFFHGDIEYAVIIEGNVGLLGEGPYYWAELAEVERENNYEFLSWRDGMEVTVDKGAATLTVVASRYAITDELGAPANAGTVLNGFTVTARRDSVGLRLMDNQEDLVAVVDRMPDTGSGPDLEVTMGVKQEGDAFLWSPAPYRLSNGGATSMVYEVVAYNAGERQTFALATGALPKDWKVTLPFDRLVLDKEDEESFPILVTTPSGHNHGRSDSFVLTMTGQQDKNDVGRIEMGITYPKVPQPAGHHPKLWIHSYEPYTGLLGEAGPLLGGPFGNSLQGYMNALEDDESDLGVPIPGEGTLIPGIESSFWWWMPLVPDLGMGLDFDTKLPATLNIPLNYDYVAQDVVLRGSMYLWSEALDGGVQVGEIQASTPTSWSQGVQEFEVIMDILDEADFIPYSPHAYLYLDLNIRGNFIGVGPFGPGAQPAIMPGASLVLPLNEYHDEVTEFYRAVESLRFDADFLERPVNPGKTVVFETRLRNVETVPQTVVLNLTGASEEWGHILGDTEFELGAGQERKIAVSVVVPSEASDGIADFVLAASNKDDPLKTALINLITVIDTEVEHPDQADLAGALDVKTSAQKKAPGFEIAAIMLGLLAIALVMRKRRA